MIEQASIKLADKLITENIITIEDKEVYSYGFQLLLSMILKGTGLIVLGLVTGHVAETIIFVLTFGLLRIFAGGIHAHSYFKCFAVTVALVYAAVWLSNQLNSHSDTILILAIILILSNALVFLFSPIDSPNKPLSKQEKIMNRHRSIMVITIGSIMIVSSFILVPAFQYHSIIASLGFFIEALTLINVSKIKQLTRRNKNESYI